MAANMGKILDGKTLSSSIIGKVKVLAEGWQYTPHLAIISVGDNVASSVYIKKKNEACEAIGIKCIVFKRETTTTEELIDIVGELNSCPVIDGILVQLPLPKEIDTSLVLNSISPDKDVDGFSFLNQGALWSTPEGEYEDCNHLPCTPSGIIRLLEEYKIQISGKRVVIIGRSNIVGKPLAAMFLNRDATVTICHSKTQNLSQITSQADILVSAVGKAGFVTADMVKEGAVVIDVGINRGENGKLCGDVDFAAVEPKTSYITPVPGGVGPMTVAMLMKNVAEVHECKEEI